MRIRYIFVVLLLSFFGSNLFGQEVFSRIIDLENRTSQLMTKLSSIDDRIFAEIATVCENATIECAKIIEFDVENGDTVQMSTMTWLDPGLRSLDLRGDTLEISGHDYGVRSKFYLHRQSLEGDSLETFELLPPTDLYAMSITGNITFGDYSLVFGNCRRTDTDDIPALLFWVNALGEVDSLMIVEEGSFENHIYDAAIGPDGFLTVLIDYGEMTPEPFPFVRRRKKLVKYNQNREEVWSWVSDESYNFDNLIFSRLEILSDGTMVITADDNSQSKEEIWGIDETGIQWKYSFPIAGTNRYRVINLIEATNGDILGCGQIRDSPVYSGQNGYLFRMSAEGEMLWERMIVDNANEVSGFDDLAFLIDLVELDDGSIMAGGYQTVWYENAQGSPVTDRDLWIVRTDADGCIIPNCGYVQDIPLYTNIAEIPEATLITLFPNPARELLTIDWPEQLKIKRLQLHNALGVSLAQQVPVFSSVQLDVQAYPVGLYYVTLEDSDGRIYTKKVMITE